MLDIEVHKLLLSLNHNEFLVFVFSCIDIVFYTSNNDEVHFTTADHWAKPVSTLTMILCKSSTVMEKQLNHIP